MKAIISMYLIVLLASTSGNANESNCTEGKDDPKSPTTDQVITCSESEDSTAQELKALMDSHQKEMKALLNQDEQNNEQYRVIQEEYQKALLTLLGYEKS